MNDERADLGSISYTECPKISPLVHIDTSLIDWLTMGTLRRLGSEILAEQNRRLVILIKFRKPWGAGAWNKHDISLVLSSIHSWSVLKASAHYTGMMGRAFIAFMQGVCNTDMHTCSFHTTRWRSMKPCTNSCSYWWTDCPVDITMGVYRQFRINWLNDDGHFGTRVRN